VFVVGYLGDWRRAAAVLFEPASLRGDSAPSREKGKGVAAPIASCAPGGSGYRNDPDTSENLIANTIRVPSHGATWRADGADNFGIQQAFGGNNTAGPIEVATACNAHGGPAGRLDFESETFVTHALRADGFDASEDGTGRGTPLVPVQYGGTRGRMDDGSLARAERLPTGALRHVREGQRGGAPQERGLERQRADQSGTALSILPSQNASAAQDVHRMRQSAKGAGLLQQTSSAVQAVGQSVGGEAEPTQPNYAVRRLTPRECERLQGFPDDYTLIPWRKGVAPDGPRYKALGNSMAVPVVRWIGERIADVERLNPKKEENSR
jgi:DNA (cytosine-5)-methyltransferase 1